MKIIEEKPIMVFKKTYEEKTFYSLGLSKKGQDGKYENGYIACQFKKGVNLENQTKIYIKEAWMSFYTKDKKTTPYVFINEYETVEQKIEQEKDPFKEFAEENNITDDMLPF